jgi:hypothetical protein
MMGGIAALSCLRFTGERDVEVGIWLLKQRGQGLQQSHSWPSAGRFPERP